MGDTHIVSVIIPTLGRETLAQCQAALQRQTRPPDEVIVVLDRERRGVAWGRNQGIRQARGDLVAITDDDAIPPDDWLERLIGAIDRHDADVAGGTFQETDPLLHAIRSRKRMPSTEEVDHAGLVGNGGNIMFRRRCLETCIEQDGYAFNEQFGTAEDWEMILRLRQRGARLVYVPAPVTHLRRVTPLGYLRHCFQRGKGISLLYQAIRADPNAAVPQDSLLWGGCGRRERPRWWRAAWEKLIGPFGMRTFPTRRLFVLYWLGEKAQSGGFLWQLACDTLCALRREKRVGSKE